MKRHPFRWEALAFGLLFLTVVGTWTAWKTGLLAGDQLGYAPAGTLIVLGVAGIIASFTSPRAAVEPPNESAETEEVPDDIEQTDAQS